ncbi:Polyadenylate-binding protein-interacting protein 3 [Zea mays]|uniref:Polyadenylate-binding protein-interacting protein 3 n=1 Tax=Zea mays TaxID=4577 RepID=C0HFN1_MAIZE|nr:unknown [Zea mays]AQK46331.1 Polyadenylate-binding protein-interacting protein 3 [Zea mays]
MARPRKPPPPSPPKAAAPSIADALLLATVCMVGLPVEVRVRDGSAYAGVLHTACVDAGYGVVLKKAKKIANGKGDVNLSLGSFVDTLVVCPDDLVQVIAKGLSLPLKGVCKPLDSNVVAASGSLKPQISHANDPKMSNKTKNMSPLMYVINSSHAYCYVLFHIYEKSHMDCMYASYLAPI